MRGFLEKAYSPDKSFFEDEEREGFFVSSMMKRYWAAQLKVLAEINKVCEKHGIKWFADCGTLLGTVRHGGFIPWDDDLDICMFRHDFERFFAVAKEELPEKYQVLNIHTEKEYTQMLGRIVNTNVIDYGREHLENNFGCPYTVGIDIFPLDGLADDEAEEGKRRKALKSITDAVDLIGKGNINTPKCRAILADIERTNHTVLHRRGNIMRELLFLAEKLYTMYPSDKAMDVALMPFWVSDHNHRYSKELFEQSVLLPFEYVRIPVPARYEEVLNIEYGSYMHVSKKGGIHEYPVYKEQEEMLVKKLGGNPYRYTMPKEIRPMRNIKTIADSVSEILSTIRQAHEQIRMLCEQNDFESAGQLMEGCQTLAISLGTTAENRMSGGIEAVHVLEDYCELLYEISGDYNGDESIRLLNEKIDEADSEFGKALQTGKKEILFLPCKAAWWKCMEPEWRKAVSDPQNDVYVMPLPYMIKDFLGEEGDKHDDSSLFPEYVKLTDIAHYDIEKRHPDTVYIQNPYDGWNSMFSVPDFFFSEKLLAFTDELIYVPHLELADPDSEDDKITAAMKVFIEQPAVYYADRVVVRTDALKAAYVDFLVGITGKTSRDYWEGKITVATPYECDEEAVVKKDSGLPEAWTGGRDGYRFILFQENAAFLSEYKDDGVRKVSESLSLMSKEGERIVCVFSPHESLDMTEDNRWKTLVSEAQAENGIIYDKEHLANRYADDFDGYYGCSGSLAHKCAEAGIPVMLMTMQG